MNKLATGTYWLDIRDFDNEVAHLYEHMLIQTFINSLKTQGISQYLFGWIDGETFHDVMFISYNFYLPDAEKLFTDFIASQNRIDFSLCDLELNRLQAESESTATYDKPKVLDELHAIDKATLADIAQLKTPHYFPSTEHPPMSLITLKPSKTQFEQISIAYCANNLSTIEKALFMRITPIISESISEILHAAGGYTLDDGIIKDDQESNSMARSPLVFSIKKGTFTNEALQVLLGRSTKLLSNHILDHPEQLTWYIRAFESDPAWIDSPIEYYRNSGLLTSRNLIAQSFTPEKVAEMIAKVLIAVKAS